MMDLAVEFGLSPQARYSATCPIDVGSTITLAIAPGDKLDRSHVRGFDDFILF